MTANTLLNSERLPDDHRRVVRGTVVVVDTHVTLSAYCLLLTGIREIAGLSMMFQRVDLAAQNEILNVFFDDRGNSSVSNVTLAVLDTSFSLSSGIVALQGIPGLMSHVLVAFTNATVRAGQGLWIFDTERTGSVTNLEIAVTVGSCIHFFEAGGDFLALKGALSMSYISILISSSSIITLHSIANVANMSAVRNYVVLVVNSTLHANLAFCSMFLVDVICGPVTFTVKNSAATFNTSNTITSAFVSIRAASDVKAPIAVFIMDSSVLMSVFSTFYTLVLLQLSSASFLDAADSLGGSFRVTIRNSTVRLSQAAPNAIDSCHIYAATAVNVTSPGALMLVIQHQSVISVACAAFSTLFRSQQSNSFAFQIVADDGAQIYLSTTSLTRRSAAGQYITGSFVVLVVNSLVSNTSVSISNCSITCGFVCQLVGVGWEDSPMFNFIITSLLGYLPPTTMPCLRNSSIGVRNCTITTLAPPTRLSIEKRSLVSLANTTNMTIELMGPLEFSAEGFTSIVDISGYGDGGDEAGMNRLVLLNCEAISVSRSLAVGASAVNLPLKRFVAFPPLEQGAHHFLAVESIRTGGVGSCGLTTSISSDVTASSTLSWSTATPTTSPVIPAVEVELLMSLSRSVLGGSVGLMALVSGPAMAMSVQVLHAQLLVSGCRDAATDKPIDVASSPTQLTFGRRAGMYNRGAVVGNVMLLTACSSVASVALLVFHFQKRAASEMGFPGILYVPYSILLVPTVTSATMLLVPPREDATPRLATDVAVGVLGFTVVLAPLIALAVLTTTKRWFGARPVRVPLRGIRGSAVQRQLKVWYKHRTVFDNLPGRPGFVERWEYAGITDYVANRQWFAVAKQTLGLATGLIAGLTALGVGWCTALNALQSVVTVGFLVTLVLLRPHCVRADQWASVSSSLLESATALLGLLGRDVSTVMLVVQLVVGTLYLVGLLSAALVEGSCRRHGSDRHRSTTGTVAINSDRQLRVAREEEEIFSIIACTRLCSTREEALHVLVEAVCRKAPL